MGKNLRRPGAAGLAAIPWLSHGYSIERVYGGENAAGQCWRGFQAGGPGRIGADLGRPGNLARMGGQKRAKKGKKAQMPIKSAINKQKGLYIGKIPV